MQHIPKGIPMHEKLSTTFVRVEALFDELQTQGFTGYVLLHFPQSTGYIYISNGQVLNATEDLQHERNSGRKISDHLLRQATQTKGTISIYNLQSEAVRALAGIADGEIIYDNLTSDFASVGKLIKKIARERKLHFISLTFSDQPSEGGLVYIDGEHIEVFCSTSQGPLTGSQALQQLVTQSEGRLATFCLYRAKASDMPAFDEKDVESSLNRLTQNSAPITPPMTSQLPSLPLQAAAAFSTPPPPTTTGSLPATSGASAKAGNEVSSFIKTRPEPPNGGATSQPKAVPAAKPANEETDNILEVTESETDEVESLINSIAPKPAIARHPVAPVSKPTPASVNATVSASLNPVATQVTLAEPKSEGEMSELTGLMSQIIAAVERGMTVAGRGSSFPTALRAGLLAVTEQYPFLDPFAAEFEYHDREIVFVGSARPDEFSKGLTEALRQMVEDLIYSSNGRVRDYISEELVKVEREHNTDLTRFGLDNITKRICQN